MAINLNAEQKSIRKLFYNTDQYVIPEFQRAYSWEYEQCAQFYNDLLNAFIHNTDYFLGNIVLARSKENENTPHVIDGQQRLITIWVLLKVFSVFVEDLDLETTVLKIRAWKKGEEDSMKIISCVGDQRDGENLKILASYDASNFHRRLECCLDSRGKTLRIDKCANHIEYTALLFYQYLANPEITSSRLEDFTNFVLDKVSLLPIQMGGEKLNEARENALTIFETINNRGMDLQDADIFKARLYAKAMAAKDEDNFMVRWNGLKENVVALHTSVDEIFRCYYHIIRGIKGLTTAEKKLRDFFLNDRISPLTYGTHSEVMNDLEKIIKVHYRLKEYEKGNGGISSWLQVLNTYTNTFPRYALVAYLFNYEQQDPIDFLRYIKSIARYVYYMGSTTSVKFGIYGIIQRMSERLPINDFYQDNLKFSDLSSSSRLLTGYSLIAYYQANNPHIKNPLVEKIVYESEIAQSRTLLGSESIDYDDVYTLGNSVVLGSSLRGRSITERLKSIQEQPTGMAIKDDSIFNKNAYKRRQKAIQTLLVQFFLKDENNTDI